MLETKPLAEVTLEDLKEFLNLRVPEGARLDYKEAWDDEVVKHVAALANTQGGHVLIGVAEDRPQGPGGVRLNVPRSGDVLGVAHGGRDLAARYRDRVVSATQPRLAPEVKAIPLGDGSENVVVVVRVPQSPDAPHEVYQGKDPRIVVRRQDSSQPATLEEIERLIERRSRARQARYGEVDLDFFERRLVRGGSEDAEPVRRGTLQPTLAALVRPRKALAAGFAPDHGLDRQVREIGLRLDMFDTVRVTPSYTGVALEEPAAEGLASSRLEVRKDGSVRYARALPASIAGHGNGPNEQGRQPEARLIDFEEISGFLQRAVAFAAKAHGLSGPIPELEAFFGLDGCAGCTVRIPVVTLGTTPYRSYRGVIEHSRALGSAAVAPDPATSRSSREGMLSLVRELSRTCGMSVPDARLDAYVEGL